jgi:hypothetical protein
MTLQDIKNKLFPATYRARNGDTLEIIGYGFIGKPRGGSSIYVWDENMNFKGCIQQNINRAQHGLDGVELLTSPSNDPIGKDRKI